MPEPIKAPAIPPVPESAVRVAYKHLMDATAALQRPMTTEAQIEDVMRSVDHFVGHARKAMEKLKRR